LIVADTYRIMGHTIGDPLTYRLKGEVEAWQEPAHDPILRFKHHLIEHQLIGESQLDALDAEARQEIAAAVQFALASPEPEVPTLWDDVYAKEYEQL
jgi:pyruvate dehydrogenase E1 component alpha subunit